MNLCHLPDDLGTDVGVLVSKDVPDPRNLPPWNFRVTFLQVLRNGAACFGDDLYAAFDRTLDVPRIAVRFERGPCEDRFDALDGFPDVDETREGVTSFHQKS